MIDMKVVKGFSTAQLSWEDPKALVLTEYILKAE